jgi:LacI family transcriptional regulator
VGNEAVQHDFDLLVSTRPPDTSDEEDAYRRLVEGRRLDGLLVVRTRTQDRRIAYLSQAHFPFVAFGRSELGIDYPCLDVDSFQGLELAAQHLIDLGHTDFAFISPPQNLMFTVYRRAGLEATLERRGLSLQPEYCVVGDLTQQGGFEAMNELLDLPSPPTAVLGGNDLMALGAISASQKRGLVVGRDVAIVGFDDIFPAEHSHPSLTTVRQPIHDIGRRICRMLIRLINGDELTERCILLQPELIVRESCGAPG